MQEYYLSLFQTFISNFCISFVQFQAQCSSISTEVKQVNEEFEDINVELSKPQGKGLGLSVVGRRDGCGVFISDMVSKTITEVWNEAK